MIVVVEEKTAIGVFKNMQEDRARQFVEVLQRAYRPNPDRQDIEELQTWLDEYPEIWHLVFDMARVIEANLIRRIVPDQAAHLALEKNVESIRHDLGYEKATALESSLIDNIVLSWLRWQWTEYQLVVLMGAGETGISASEFWERRLSAAQGRYLRACETLAKIRRLAARSPTLQVNIASESGQQVNIAGDVVK